MHLVNGIAMEAAVLRVADEPKLYRVQAFTRVWFAECQLRVYAIMYIRIVKLVVAVVVTVIVVIIVTDVVVAFVAKTMSDTKGWYGYNILLYAHILVGLITYMEVHFSLSFLDTKLFHS